MGAVVSWGSEEESGEDEAACWAGGSLLSVIPTETYRRLGYSAVLDHMLLPASHSLFSTSSHPRSYLPVSGSGSYSSLGPPTYTPLPWCFWLQAFCTHCSHLEGPWSVFQTSFFFSKPYLFTWLPWVLVAACGIFVAVCALL